MPFLLSGIEVWHLLTFMVAEFCTHFASGFREQEEPLVVYVTHTSAHLKMYLKLLVAFLGLGPSFAYRQLDIFVFSQSF